MPLTLDDLRAVLESFRESGYGELKLRIDALSITVRKDGLASRAGETAAASGTAHDRMAARLSEEADAVVVRAAISGTFYRTPSPGADAFCRVGDRVEPHTTLGLIEVMKLFTSVQAGVSGTVMRIVPENGTLVEPGQPLVVIRQDEVRT